MRENGDLIQQEVTRATKRNDPKIYIITGQANQIGAFALS